MVTYKIEGVGKMKNDVLARLLKNSAYVCLTMTLSLPSQRAIDISVRPLEPKTVKEAMAKIRERLQAAAKAHSSSSPEVSLLVGVDDPFKDAFKDTFKDTFKNAYKDSFKNTSGVTF